MCLPMLGAVAGIAGSVVSAMGAASQAQAQAQKDEYDAKVAKANALAETQKGMKQEEDIGVKFAKLEGQQIATAAKGGVDPGYGSAALIIFGETKENELHDRDNAYLNARSKSIAYENQAQAYEMSAQNHRKAGKIAAAGSFLSGLAGGIKSFGKGGGGDMMIDS